jgi:hypothetical protein
VEEVPVKSVVHEHPTAHGRHELGAICKLKGRIHCPESRAVGLRIKDVTFLKGDKFHYLKCTFVGLTGRTLTAWVARGNIYREESMTLLYEKYC